MATIISPAIQALAAAKEQFGAIAEVHHQVTYKAEAEFARQIIKAGIPRDVYSARNCLFQCDPITIHDSLINVAAIGLTLNPALKLAYLVPRFNRKRGVLECKLEISYQGMVQLAVETGAVKYAVPELVYQDDIDNGTFIYQGPSKPPIHKGNPFAVNRGRPVGAYCVAGLASGDYITTTMTRAELDAAAAKGADNSPARAEFAGEMDKKTVIRRAFKYWPKPRNNPRLLSLDAMDNGRRITSAATSPEPGPQPEPDCLSDQGRAILDVIHSTTTHENT